MWYLITWKGNSSATLSTGIFTFVQFISGNPEMSRNFSKLPFSAVLLKTESWESWDNRYQKFTCWKSFKWKALKNYIINLQSKQVIYVDYDKEWQDESKHIFGTKDGDVWNYIMLKLQQYHV